MRSAQGDSHGRVAQGDSQQQGTRSSRELAAAGDSQQQGTEARMYLLFEIVLSLHIVEALHLLFFDGDDLVCLKQTLCRLPEAIMLPSGAIQYIAIIFLAITVP